MEVLLIIDVQNDFCPGGALAAPNGDEVVPVINSIIPEYTWVVFTQDWHPPDHGSFASQHLGKQPFEMGELSGEPQMLWPDHCVWGTYGAMFHPASFGVEAPCFSWGRKRRSFITRKTHYTLV